MTPQAALTLVCIGLVCFGLVGLLSRFVQHVWSRYHTGRRLIEASGSKEYAEAAIILAKKIREGRDEETDAMIRKGMRYLRDYNVVPFRIVNKGNPVNFEKGPA